MIITLFSFCGIRIVFLIYMLSKWYDLKSIDISYPVSWAIAVLLTALYVKINAGKNLDNA